MGSLDGPAQVSPGGKEPSSRAAPAQEVSAEMLGASHSGPPASRLRRKSLGAWPRPPSTRRVSAQVGSSCSFCFHLSFLAAAMVRTQCPSISSLEQGKARSLLHSQGYFKAGQPGNFIKLTQESS